MKNNFLGLFFLLIVTSSWAQTECHMYHKKNCIDKEGIHMKYDSQSKSVIMGKGQSSEFHLVAYKNLDYRINICVESNLGDQIQFKVFEKKKVLLSQEGGSKHKVEKELLYDNSSDSYSKRLEFTAENTMSLIIEVSIPGDGGASKLKLKELGCVGVLIEHMKTHSSGY